MLRQVHRPLVTTWPVVTEAMHLLARGGWQAQRVLWDLVLSDEVELVDLDVTDLECARGLMEKYRDKPMDLADATLVAIAERRRMRQVLTLDGDFRLYRPATREAFEILPG